MFAETLAEAEEIILNLDRSVPHSVVRSPEEAREVVAELGNYRCVVVDVPSIDRLNNSYFVFSPLLRMVKDRNWFVDSAYMLSYADSLADSLVDLNENEISSLLDVFNDTILYYLDLGRGEDVGEVDPYAGPPMEVLFPPLQVSEPTAAAAASALLALLDGMDEDPAEAAKAKTALLHALHGLGGAQKRAADLCKTLIGMRKTVNTNCGISVHTSNNLVCRDLALCCTKLTGATGMLSSSEVGADDTPFVLPSLDTDEIAARVACLQRLQARTHQFGLAINLILDAPVSFDSTRSLRYWAEKERFNYGGLDLRNYFADEEEDDNDDDDNDNDDEEEEGGAGDDDDEEDVAGDDDDEEDVAGDDDDEDEEDVAGDDDDDEDDSPGDDEDDKDF